MKKDSLIYVAGHRGLVGRALCRTLGAAGYHNLVGSPHENLDLRQEGAVMDWFAMTRPEYVFMCAARVGGIKDNAQNPVVFFRDNVLMEMNVLLAAVKFRVKKLVFLGSSCIYPRNCPQPIREEYLMTGPIEPTTEPYALAKIAGVRLCQWLRETKGVNFVSAMPCNLYGPNDTFDLERSHIVPSMMARMDRAKLSRDPVFKVWGTGRAVRELLHCDDAAEALIKIMESYDSSEPINVGSGVGMYVSAIAEAIRDVVEYRGTLEFDASQPEGTPHKVLETSKIQRMGWFPVVNLGDGLLETYLYYQSIAGKK